MNDTSPCVLAIDLGSSGPKVSVVNRYGDILSTRSGSFETIYKQQGKSVEQDAENWWQQVLQLSKQVIDESCTASNIVAIGTCAQYFTSIPVDTNGNATHPAIMWDDSRAAPFIQRAMGGFPSIMGYNIFKLLRWVRAVGIPPILLGVDAASHMLYLKNEIPEVWKHTYKVLEPADFLTMKLTGKFTTNENTGFAYMMIKKAAWGKGEFDSSLINALGLDHDKYPELVPVGHNLGSPTKEVIKFLGLTQDVKVFSGMQDTTATVMGGGAFTDYDLVLEIGTTLNTGVLVPKRIINILKSAFSVSSPIHNKYVLVGEPGSGAKSLNYLLNNFLRLDDPLTKVNVESDRHYAALADTLAAESPPGCNGLLFLPWIFGATFPEPDTAMRGGFINMNQRTNRQDMIRAVFESYAMNMKWVLQTQQQLLGHTFTKATFTGGGALWNTAVQICADMLQIPLHIIEEPRQANTKGTAYMCLHNLGIADYETLKKNIKIQKVVQPNKDLAALYNKRFEQYQKAYHRMRPLYRIMNNG